MRIPSSRVFALLLPALATLALGFGVSSALTPAALATPVTGVTGYQVVKGAVTYVANATPAGSYNVADAYCPRGTVPVSGGAVGHNSRMFIGTSIPTDDGQGWQVAATFTGNAVGYQEWFQPYAVCVDALSVPGYHVAKGAMTNNGNGASTASDAYCRHGEIAVGGGAWRHNPLQFIRTTVPTDDSQGWQVVMTNTANVAWTETFQTYAVCIPRADVTNYAVLISAPVSNANGSSDASYSPYCPANEIAISAGARSHDPLEFVRTLQPVDPRSWEVVVTNTAHVSWTETFQSYSVCVSAGAA